MRLSRSATATKLCRLGCVSFIAAVACAAGAPAQEGTTGTSDGVSGAVSQDEPFKVTISSPASGKPIPASGEISFEANKAGAAYRCLVGSVTADPCTSPVPYGPLEPGTSFTFAVFATFADERSTDRAAYTIAEDATPPVLTVTIASAPSGTVADTTARISFSASRLDARFRCTFDGVAAGCSSPQRYRDLSNGTHVFSVIARAGDDLSEPKTASWTVNVGAPAPTRPPRAVITSAPEGRVTVRRARLAF